MDSSTKNMFGPVFKSLASNFSRGVIVCSMYGAQTFSSVIFFNNGWLVFLVMLCTINMVYLIYIWSRLAILNELAVLCFFVTNSLAGRLLNIFLGYSNLTSFHVHTSNKWRHNFNQSMSLEILNINIIFIIEKFVIRWLQHPNCYTLIWKLTWRASIWCTGDPWRAFPTWFEVIQQFIRQTGFWQV